ncbi:hypothetical protein RvY_14492-1 [Ramazzottius varieornatus]|uniref:Uncharacterized protein n=1 Tax=Ramazzottius varieornatus TaxID=947166 RepID=A0A1D1VTG8_RAMVA|nr:hypothetical protein RvY_14492-1 [Ramazzottius varieornatus]
MMVDPWTGLAMERDANWKGVQGAQTERPRKCRQPHCGISNSRQIEPNQLQDLSSQQLRPVLRKHLPNHVTSLPSHSDNRNHYFADKTRPSRNQSTETTTCGMWIVSTASRVACDKIRLYRELFFHPCHRHSIQLVEIYRSASAVFPENQSSPGGETTPRAVSDYPYHKPELNRAKRGSLLFLRTTRCAVRKPSSLTPTQTL